MNEDYNVPTSIMTYRIYNHSDQPIIIRKNGGINVILDPVHNAGYNATVTVQVDFLIQNLNNVLFDIEGCQNVFDKEVLIALNDEVTKRKSVTDATFHAASSANITVLITLANRHGVGEDRSIVSHLLGFSISQQVSHYKKTFLGPTSTSVKQEMKSEIDKSHSDDLSVGIRVNDINNEIGPIWTSVMGEARQIPNQRNETIPEGVYLVITRNKRIVGQDFIALKELTEDKLKELGLYYTKRAAQVGGHGKFLQSMQSKVVECEKISEKAKEEASATNVKNILLNLRVENLKLSHRLELLKCQAKEEIQKINSSSGWEGVFKSAGGFFSSLFSFLKFIPV